jgi:hypothetical protein
VSNALKKKLVLIFQDIFSRHPIFEKVEVYTKFPKEERPKMALIIRAVTGSSQKLSLNNIVAIHHGRASLANLQGIAGHSIEWVRDDQEDMENLSAPGFYVVKITEHQENSNSFKFTIDPFLLVDDEVLVITANSATLKNLPMNPNSEVVYSENFELKKDIDYTINYQTGILNFLQPVTTYEPISVDYQVLATQIGPLEIEYYQQDNVSIPGVIMAFGDRLRVGDEQVVVIDKEMGPVAKVFGGRWIMNVDLIGVAQDPDQQERLLDYAITAFWAEYQDKLANEGIAINDFSLSGEAEDLEVEIPEEYNFTGGISFTAETDWEVYVPMITTVRRVLYNYGEQTFKNTLSNASEDAYDKREFDERMHSSDHPLGIQIVPSLESFPIYPSVFPRVITREYQ